MHKDLYNRLLEHVKEELKTPKDIKQYIKLL